MILYSHGFSSNGLSLKAQILREHFEDFLAPSFSYIPDLAANTLDELIQYFLKKGERVHLIGSSVGGYFSAYFADKYDLKAILINPAITPYKFTNFTGLQKSMFDKSKFECTLTHLEALKKYELLNIKKPQNFMLLLQKGDKLLDYSVAAKKFENSHLIIDEGGNHSFEGLEKKLEVIENFLNLKNSV